MKYLVGSWALAASLACGGALAQNAVRPEVGKPLQAAGEFIKAQRYKEAMAKIRDADNVGGKTAEESFLIERMRLAAASGSGDAAAAAKSFETLSTSSKVSAADKLRMIESIAGSYYRARDYSKAMQWYQRYFQDGGTNAANRTLLIQTQYLSGDYAGAEKELMAEIQAAERNGSVPPEDRINLLMNAALKQKDINAETYALEKLVVYYPKKEYWSTLLNRLQRKPGFSDRLLLDTYRLSLATGSLNKAGDYMEMAQLALQADSSSEAKQVVDKGFASGMLGSGPEAGRHQRLRDLVLKKLAEEKVDGAVAQKAAESAKDGSDLISIGFDMVFAGQAAKGVSLMQRGIAKGGLKRADDAKLHLGVAQVLAGEAGKAQATFKTVAGTDGAADLARLWTLYARRKS